MIIGKHNHTCADVKNGDIEVRGEPSSKYIFFKDDDSGFHVTD